MDLADSMLSRDSSGDRPSRNCLYVCSSDSTSLLREISLCEGQAHILYMYMYVHV